MLDAQAAIRELQPHVVVVDSFLPDILSLLHVLRADRSSCRTLVLAVPEDITRILEYAEAGADGFVSTNGSVVELVEAIERTAVGELLCSPRVAGQLLRRVAHSAGRADARSPAASLTIREQQVFALLRQGRSNKEIGVALAICEATVKDHVHHAPDERKPREGAIDAGERRRDRADEAANRGELDEPDVVGVSRDHTGAARVGGRGDRALASDSADRLRGDVPAGPREGAAVRALPPTPARSIVWMSARTKSAKRRTGGVGLAVGVAESRHGGPRAPSGRWS